MSPDTIEQIENEAAKKIQKSLQVGANQFTK